MSPLNGPTTSSPAFLRGENRRRDGFDFFIAKFPAFTRVRIQTGDGNFCARQAQIAARLRGEFDGQIDFLRREFFGNGLDGNVNRGQRHAQPASAFIRAQQHHRGAFGPGESGEKFGLAREFMAGANDGFLVDRRGDERVEFPAEAAFRALTQPGHGGTRGHRRTGRQMFRQWSGQRIRDEKPAGVAVTGKLFQRQIESGILIELPR